ncbi:DAK2 domain-containing protein [Nocardioides sp. HDW12B]|nr:DAK2 domain-containing protein [Nocardioides sp. HDW12B]
MQRFSALATEALRTAREEIDALNVYPVPDGDTGTNLFLTFEAADDALREALEQGGPEVARVVAAYTRGLLLGARGNSGVIMSQLVGALFRRIAAAGPDDRAATVVAEGMRAATAAGYAAVGDPVEGTMLTVARAASEAALAAAADPTHRTAQVFEAASRAAGEALDRTPEQLEVLRRSGVVDAGGRGLCLVLDAAAAAFTGRRELTADVRRPRRPLPAPTDASAHPLPTDDLTEDGPAYEVMYLLDAADDAAVDLLRRELMPLGDSLVVVGGEGLWNVHVHVDDVGAAIEAGIRAGRPHRVRVTHFAEQVEQARRAAARAHGPRTGRAVVVVALGDGLAEVFAEAGATVVTSEVTRRPSAGRLVEAIRATGAGEVVVVPNSRDVLPAAEAAARLVEAEDAVRVAVVPTRAQVQGMAALAVHEPGRPFEQDLVEMTAAARHARSGAVTVAARQAITSAGPCEAGDVLGAVEGDFVVVGQDLATVAVDVLERMLRGGGELVTLIAGQGGDEVAARCEAHLAQEHPSIDVLRYEGAQERYPVLLGVE